MFLKSEYDSISWVTQSVAQLIETVIGADHSLFFSGASQLWENEDLIRG